jgi:hypothetical protein
MAEFFNINLPSYTGSGPSADELVPSIPDPSVTGMLDPNFFDVLQLMWGNSSLNEDVEFSPADLDMSLFQDFSSLDP